MTELNTAQHRNLAMEASKRLDWLTGADHWDQAIDKHPHISQRGTQGLHGLDIEAMRDKRRSFINQAVEMAGGEWKPINPQLRNILGLPDDGSFWVAQLFHDTGDRIAIHRVFVKNDKGEIMEIN